MAALADVLDSFLSRPAETSPTVTPTSDHGMFIFLMLSLLLVFVLAPVFLAVTGALSMRLSRGHIPDFKNCAITSYAAGIMAVVLGVVIYAYTSALVAGPSFEDLPLSARVGNSTSQVIGSFTSPGVILIMLLAALISTAGGAFYWMATRHAAAK